MTTAASVIASPGGRIRLAGRRVHFVGIAGAGMSGLARLAQRQGAVCTGSDIDDGPTVDALRRDGLEVILEQNATSVPRGCDLVVASAAIRPDHPELMEAHRRGVRIVKYAAMLGAMMRGRTGVAIAGTHGKSSTTSLLSHALIQAGLDPSFIVGANCEQIGGGSRTGESDILVAEACEYDRSFHHLHPTHATILNVETDHLDCYGSLEAIVESFAAFARRLPPTGSLLIHHESPHRAAITAGLDCRVETIGFEGDADWRVVVEGARASDHGSGNGHIRNRTILYRQGVAVCDWPSPLPGDHMAYNAAAAAITAHRLGAPWGAIAEALGAFRGLDRRMQLIGTKGNANGQHSAPRTLAPSPAVRVVDDYGHHPTEIHATLCALREHYRPRRLICVFQPHQHSRTRFLLDEFATSFRHADLLIAPDIYFVRDSEQDRQAVTAADLVERVRSEGVEALHIPDFDAIVNHLERIAEPGDLVVTMGAGDVWKIARELTQRAA